MRYKPHNYQTQATSFIINHDEATVFLGMGLGKSVIALTAIWQLVLDYFLVQRVLVIAPLRVARDTWPQEAAKWDHLTGLTLAVAVGSKQDRLHALAKSAMVTVINRENIPWLVATTARPGLSTWSSLTNSPASKTTVQSASPRW